ncbi:hypothetical protein [Nocardia alba]|uniref:Uncharacterized protein n=1 Tax=Nocardia alba TaxID=225051 RepID=A0A4R1G3J9_9NOCA|nr:hypothetical protein [Nocardia alba]TCK01003.1 hypothetical protein DFR71_2022 [Nocardia alba]
MTDPTPGGEQSHDIVPRTDRGLTEAGDAGHKAYVMARIAEAATQLDKIRDPLDWQRQVELWGDRKLLHDTMMYGHQHLQGRTEAQGWRHEHPQPTTLGPRRHDAAQVVRVAGVEIVGTTTEFKAGWVSKKEGLRQLYKERELLAKGLTQDRSEYIIRESHPPHPEVMREAQQLAKDYPGKFVVVELSEPQFERAVEAGRPIVRAKTVEKLGHLIEKVRDSPELRTVPRALEQFTREIEKAKERGNPIGLEALVQARDDLAYLVEADKGFTQRVDKAAREASQLRLKEAQIVEQVQAQQRDQRAQALWQQVARVDREIVLSAVSSVRAQVPAKTPVKQLELPGVDPVMARAMGGMLHLMQQREIEDRLVLEREVLQGLALPTPVHREVAELVLAQQRDTRGQAVTVEHVKAAEQDIREKARAVQAREVRERENRELMARIADAHNKALERAALEQGKPRGVDRLEDKARMERAPELANILRLDAKRLAERGIDPRVVDAIARGTARPDDKAHALVVEVGDGPRWVDKHSPEVALAKQIQMVDKGVDLNLVYVRQATDRGMSAPAVARSREDLEQKRLELERERTLQREPHPELKSRAREGPGLSKGIEKGLGHGR